jgi:hypothetical protein
MFLSLFERRKENLIRCQALLEPLEAEQKLVF